MTALFLKLMRYRKQYSHRYGLDTITITLATKILQQPLCNRSVLYHIYGKLSIFIWMKLHPKLDSPTAENEDAPNERQSPSTKRCQ